MGECIGIARECRCTPIGRKLKNFGAYFLGEGKLLRGTLKVHLRGRELNFYWAGEGAGG